MSIFVASTVPELAFDKYYSGFSKEGDKTGESYWGEDNLHIRQSPPEFNLGHIAVRRELSLLCDPGDCK